MKTKRDKLISLYKLAATNQNVSRGVVVDYAAFLNAISGRDETPSVKVKPISVQSNNEN